MVGTSIEHAHLPLNELGLCDRLIGKEFEAVDFNVRAMPEFESFVGSRGAQLIHLRCFHHLLTLR